MSLHAGYSPPGVFLARRWASQGGPVALVGWLLLVSGIGLGHAGPIQMDRVAVVATPCRMILAAPLGLDFDHDSHREFVIRKAQSGTGLTRFEFYENYADDAFALVHVLELAGNQLSYLSGGAGDADVDGLEELVVRGQELIVPPIPHFEVRSYEAPSPNSYPTELVWKAETGKPLEVLIADTDADGKQEIVVETTYAADNLLIYENDGDNSYALTYAQPVPEIYGKQSVEVADDLDGDGRREILYGGTPPPPDIIPRILAFENVGDNAYELVWSTDLIHDGDPVNAGVTKYAGDLDGDGKKEFLAGGFKANSSVSILYVFEAVSDDNFEIVATLSQTNGSVYTSAALADVDGDGRREIVFATTSVVSIYENTGDNVWHRIWVGTGWTIESIGAGDHDQDGKDEIIFREGGATAGFTGVWEISPAYAADGDADGKVDAIDNCPATANAGQEDVDGDAVGDACDTCAYEPNPAQGPVVFGQTLVASDAEGFAWSAPAPVVYVRGDLSGVGSYAIDEIQTLPFATGFTDARVPAAAGGFWYLVKPDCAAGSWQSELGAEPGRDATLP